MTTINPTTWTHIGTGPFQAVVSKGQQPVYFCEGETPTTDDSLAQMVIPGNEINWHSVPRITKVWARGPDQTVQILPFT